MRARFRSRRRVLGFLESRDGIAAVEFGIMAPIFGLVFAGMADLGGVLYTQFRLNAAVSAGANYAIVNASSVSSSSGATLASTIAQVVENNAGSNWADDTIVVNDGPTETVTGGQLSASGSAANADSCYCPTGSGASITWGTAQTCGATCTGGGVAGKFVTITASRTYTPLFSSYGIVQNGAVTISTTVEVQ
ncbi:MAG TPA: TadE/TadG family type IV pilus assembly protein [Caulobacteraceae bacterium]|nr:TadE/TadG family type IV pilus assembly protein [Caulobacteraceae bacterium]